MTRIKICGITNKEDAHAAVAAGVDALGFIFYEQSPRFINAESAKDIIKSLPPFIITVGVFVNHSRGIIYDIIQTTGINIVQLHGNESPDFCDDIPAKVIKAVRVKNKNIIGELERYNVNCFLLDSYTKEAYGGSGVTFDWDIAINGSKIALIILAGGLTPENVFEAITKTRPYAVDVSSGIEDRPGKKDWKKMEKFIKEVRRANESS